MICCYQVTKIFCTKYSSTIASSAWGPCYFGPFTDLAISFFREMCINTVFTQILASLEYVCFGDDSHQRDARHSRHRED